MADLADVPIKLKKQCKTACFGICILHKYIVAVCFLFQDICTESFRDHGKLQIPVISLIVVDYIVFNAVRIKGLRLSCRVHADGNGTGHCNGCPEAHLSFICNRNRCIMHIADIKFDFILFISHLLYLHLIKHLIQIFRFDPYFAFFIKNTMPIKHGFCLLFQFYIFQIGVNFYIQTICLKIHFPVCREITAARIQKYCKGRFRGFAFRKMMIGIRKTDLFHQCHHFFMCHHRNPLSIFCRSSLLPFSSAGAICSLPATLPPPRFAWPCSRRCAIWYLSLECTVMVRELLLSAVFLTVQLFLYLPVRFGAFACISFFTVLDASFTASLTVSVARSAYSFRPSMIASASPSTVVLLSAICSPLCQGSPYFDCLILILHVIDKGNIVEISTENNTVMLRIKT
nr:MAG TPA: hypothetical protein [Caudoviricetes sp.]